MYSSYIDVVRKIFIGNCYYHDNMSVLYIPPYTPLLYSKTLVYRCIHFFLIYAIKHRLWVLIRTASMRRRRFKCVPTINVLSKNEENNIIFHLKINIFTAVKYCCILHGRVCVLEPDNVGTSWSRYGDLSALP